MSHSHTVLCAGIVLHVHVDRQTVCHSIWTDSPVQQGQDRQVALSLSLPLVPTPYSLLILNLIVGYYHSVPPLL